MPGADILAAPLVDLLDQLRRRELSPVDVVRAHIERIAEINPAVNAVVADRFVAALQDAEAAEQRYAATAPPPPLLGIPFTVKEMIEVADMPLTFGSLSRSTRKASGDATVVARLRAAGAIPLGVTNVPEWGMWSESYNAVYGRTRNPHDLRHTPGGSSGGEAAVVASGGSVFGIGSDIGGSVRLPAAFCGVYGHKPTTGLLPLTGHYPVYRSGPDATLAKASPYVSIGTFTRSARDVAPLLRVMAGRDRVDPNAEPLAFRNPDAVDWRGRRVLLLPAPAIRRASRTHPDLTAAVIAAAHALENRGANVAEAPAALLAQAGAIWHAAMQNVGGTTFSEILGSGQPVRLPLEIMRTATGRGRYSWPALFFCIGERIGRRNDHTVRLMMRELRRLSRTFNDLLGQDGVLVCPVHPRTAPRHNAAILRPFDFLYTAVFNALRVPATSAPVGFDAHGLPTAVQFVSGRGNDHVTLAAASVVEEAVRGAWRPASGWSKR